MQWRDVQQPYLHLPHVGLREKTIRVTCCDDIKFVGYSSKHLAPIARRTLSKEARGWIPRRIITIQQPPPLRSVLQDDPHGTSERSNDMRHRIVGCNHQIQIFYYRCCIEE